VNSFFDLTGVLVALYVVASVVSGHVYVRHRAWGKRLHRADEPRQYWTGIGVYALLAVALITVF